MARPRKPTSQHQLDGTFRPDRHGRRLDVDADLPALTKPRDLSGVAGAVWDSIVASLPPGTLSQSDSQTLEGACRWWAEWKRWTQAIDSGDADPYKAACMAGMAWKCYMSAAGKLGLSPVDRAKIDVPNGGKADPGADLEGFAAKPRIVG